MATLPEGSRARLLATGKRLFAERGLDGVSLREIVREAGIKHATAVQYHFGDREGLIAAILAPHEARVDTRRDAMLDEYEANGVPDCRSVAAILVRPLARELEDEDGPYFLRIYAQTLQRAHGMFSDTGTSIWRWRAQAEHFLPPGVGDFHPRFSAMTFTAVELARRAAEDDAPTGHPLFVSRVIDLVAAILQAPASAETERLHAEREAARNKYSDERIA